MENFKLGTIKFSKSRLEKNKKVLKYLIGQFHAIHNKGPISMYPIKELERNYRGMIWTDNLFLSFAIPNLARYFDYNSPIFKVEDRYYIYTRINDMVPTLSPNDINFKKWWSEHKSKWENEKDS